MSAPTGSSGTCPLSVTDGFYSENLIAAKKAGMNTYILKPFDARSLKAKIETEMTNRRRLVRHRMVKRGLLAYDRGARSVNCLIRDLSEGGAKIEVENAQDLPTEVVLSF